MTNRKKSRASGRAPIPTQFGGCSEQGFSTPSSSSAAIAAKLAAPLEAKAKKPDGQGSMGSRASTAPASSSTAVRDIAPLCPPVERIPAPPPLEMKQPAIDFQEPSADDFHDALEECIQSGSEAPGEHELEPLAAVIAKAPGAQIPEPSRADWEAELERLRNLSQENPDMSDDDCLKLTYEAYIALVEDARNLEEHRTATDTCLEELYKERERLRKDLNSMQAMKCKLEDSCREMQQMKCNISRESTTIVDEEKERQSELNGKFNAAMNDVEDKMKAEADIREHYIKENEELRTKFEKFTDTYQEQENKLTQHLSVRTQEREAIMSVLNETEAKTASSIANCGSLEKKNKVLQKTTTTLRADLQSVLSKFDEFHASVNGSNQKHSECKTEIDELSSQLKDLETKNVELKNDSEIAALTKDKESMKKQCDALDRLCDNLESEISSIAERLRAPSTKGGS